MAAQFGMGGTRWLGQFATGFPIDGELSQKEVFAKTASEGELPDPVLIFRTAEARFRERATKSGMENAGPLCEGALEQVGKGWLCAPVELAPSGQPEGFPKYGFNVTFRFGVEQAAKLRACDDLKHGLTNTACAVRTPIQLVSWGHLAQLCRRSCESSRGWALLKADHVAAYKQLPLVPAGQAEAIIALRRPKSGKWYGFVSRALMFGDTAAVLHYSVFSRLVTALVNRLFGIPLICFFDDFAALIHRLLGSNALQVSTSFRSLLGIRLKPGKSEVGSRGTCLGLSGWFTGSDNEHTLHISLPNEKRERLGPPCYRTFSVKAKSLTRNWGSWLE